jgi:hypothetical protein
MMTRKMFSHPMTLSLLATLLILSCSISGSPISTESPQPTDTQGIQTEPATSTSEIVQDTPGSEPSCTVLQDLNLRFGPGTAYRPPIRVLLANTVITPLGFAPRGIPGGSWAYVQDPATQDEGWVSAGSQFISCNIDLTTLPAVEFGTPPPPPLPKSTQTSDPDGNGFCIDPDSGFQCVGIFSDEFLFQFQIFSNGIELGENDGVEEVSFAVKRDGEPVYEIVEVNRSYCVFGGNGPCNPWVTEDGVFKWGPGGTPVEAGEYEMEIFATVNGDTSRWAVTFTLTLP